MTNAYDQRAPAPRNATGAARPPQQAAQPPTPARPTSPTSWAQENIAGSCANADEARNRLIAAAGKCHVVGGCSSIVLPIGHEILITVVPIIMAETYQTAKKKEGRDGQLEQEEKRGIGKSTLMQVAAAAGVQWTASERMPPMGDPLYVRWKAVGAYRDIAGVWRRIEGDRDSDFRNGSPQIAGKSDNEIAALRANIMRSTATKAKLRAIREAFGIPSSMTLKELEKPFVVARLVLTGRVDDREDRAVFIQALVQQSSASVDMLYGRPPAHVLPAPSYGQPAHQLGSGSYGPAQALPAHGGSRIDPAGEEDTGNPEAEEFGAGDQPPPVPPAPPAPEPGAPVDWSQVKSAGDFAVPFGKDRGRKISEVQNLAWFRGVLEKDLDDPDKSQFRKNTESKLKALYIELKRRGEVTPLDAAQPPHAPASSPGGDGDPPAGGAGDVEDPADDFPR